MTDQEKDELFNWLLMRFLNCDLDYIKSLSKEQKQTYIYQC